jgi:hypothetical protein
VSIGRICPKWTPIGKRSLFGFWGFEFSGKKCEFSCLFFLNRDYLCFFGEIPDYRGLKCALIAPIGRQNSCFMGRRMWKGKKEGLGAVDLVAYLVKMRGAAQRGSATHRVGWFGFSKTSGNDQDN